MDYEKRIAELEADLKEARGSLKRYRCLIESSPLGIEVFEPDGAMQLSNRSARLMLGYSMEGALKDINLFESVPIPEAERVQLINGFPVQYETVYDFGVIRQVDLHHTSFFGKKVLDVGLYPIRADEELIGYMALIRDITEDRKSEQKLVVARNKAEKSDKLKSSFLANMSHEIRTPLNSIIGFSNLLGEGDLEPKKRQEYVNVINKSSQQLLELISDIIDISKIESEKLELDIQAIDAREALNSIFNTFVVQYADSSVGFRMKLPEHREHLTFKADMVRFNQIFNNLISNAFKFTSEGFIEIGCEEPSSADSSLTFYVRDSGIGIPKEKQDIIFERFRQQDKKTVQKFGGTGLGLSICRKLMELMAGGIYCKSEPGKGSYFYFTLPRA
jgi:PAS domain S-box-containing protein